ncbi:pre-rRNA 2'-O-ribose RNA methyltransferase FTSJ3-like [Patiria miniata]|uniref:Putative rRNA methyltransferase n=1 Tax=Patiria miniata TaxID=46514 RepID=A0A913ZWU4_PATMI|nr:pre-rRNA 2'-O-ribose RNA methyltransferase FTSJ3-like [Patiria miniata]
MGKKSKTGKQRKDRYYHLAKETGYRARSAFKLIQLNRKFQFLQKSRVVIDLCAAPGGWLQVAAKNMPISSLIVGVDLFPIRPIPHVTTIVADITTEKCRTALRKELQTWKADCVLHDGAPNVGTSWVLDAFTQAQLTLSAIKLASDFLAKGGWFISKLFRSKDYQPIMWVLNQLFKKVHATKPQASRSESAEIFVVCQGYAAPDKIDPKFFDPRAIFTEVAMETKKKYAILADPNKPRKAKAEGYEEGDYLQHTVVKASDFIATDTPVELLNSASELVIDDPSIANHHLTTQELRHCCKDIKVLGRKEIRMLLNWQKKLAKEAENRAEAERKAAEEAAGKGEAKDGEADDEADSEDELEEINKQLEEAKEEEKTALKRKRKDQLKMRKKLRERLQKAMAMTTGQNDTAETVSLFALQNMKNKQQLQAISQDESEIVDKAAQEQEDHDSEIEALMNEASSDSDSDLPSELDSDEAEILMEERLAKRRKKGGGSDDDDDDENSDVDFGDDDEEEKRNPLMVDLDTADQNTRSQRRTDMWFNKPIFSGLEADEDEDFEISQMTDNYRQQGGSIIERSNKDSEDESDEEASDSPRTKSSNSKSVRFDTSITSITDQGQQEREDLPSDSSGDSDAETPNGIHGNGMLDSDDSDSDYDDEVMIREMMDTKGADQGPDKTKKTAKKNAKDKKSGFEVAPTEDKASYVEYLDPEGLAMGTLMATSMKKRREIIEHAYNRYSYGEESLPAWFTEEEVKHTRKQAPVTKEMVAEYRARLREVNARPIKKIAEAKARKRQRSMKKMEKLRKKAEAISDTVDTSEKEKLNQIKQLYKKVNKKKPKEVTYVVSRKAQAAKRVKRPRGVKGPYKVVDKRMKKDVRAMKRVEEKRKKGKRR